MTRPTLKQKLEAQKQGHTLPVNPHDLYAPEMVGRVPDTDERAVLELATAIHEAESDNAAVSWSAQKRAAAYFNEHGLGDTLDMMFRLRALAQKKIKK